MVKCVVIIVDELWLKGDNRYLYYKKLVANIKSLMSLYHGTKFHCIQDGHCLLLESSVDFSDVAISALAKVPGINSLLLAVKLPLEFEALAVEAVKLFSSINTVNVSFKIRAKRSNKKFPMNKMEIATELGGILLKNYPGLRVDLSVPDRVVDVRVMDESIYLAVEKIDGLGGFPVGVHGKILTMLSGGFDSPVASYLMAKRGCHQDFIFFYAYPHVGTEVREKLIKIMENLSVLQPRAALYIFPFGEIQKKIAEISKPEYRTVLLRKYMIMAANIVADEIGSDALVTGDSLGQVASQAINNLIALDLVSTRSIFRPLLGYTKREILDLAIRFGTHDISKISHSDMCSMFAPKKPIIKPDKIYMRKADGFVDWKTLISSYVQKIEKIEFMPNGQRI